MNARADLEHRLVDPDGARETGDADRRVTVTVSNIKSIRRRNVDARPGVARQLDAEHESIVLVLPPGADPPAN